MNSAPPAVDRYGIGLALIAVYAIWSSTYFALALVVREMPALGATGLRFVVAGVLSLAIARFWGASWPTPRQWGSAVVAGALLLMLGIGLIALAERHVGSGIAAILAATTSLWAGVLGVPFGKAATRREWLGVALGMAGVVVLTGGNELRAHGGAALLLLTASLFWALGSLVAQQLDLAAGFGGAGSELICGGALLLVWSRASGEQWPDAISLGAALAWVYSVVFGSLIAFGAYHHLIMHARPALAMSCAYVNPVGAVLIGVALGDELAGCEVWLSLGLIAGAIAVTMRG